MLATIETYNKAQRILSIPERDKHDTLNDSHEVKFNSEWQTYGMTTLMVNVLPLILMNVVRKLILQGEGRRRWAHRFWVHAINNANNPRQPKQRNFPAQ